MNKDRMFCYQCEQTAKGKGCEIQGVCGKKASTANIQDELINSAVNLSINNIDSKREEITELIIDSLFTTITNVNFKDESIKKLIDKIKVYEEGEEREDKFNIEEELWKNEPSVGGRAAPERGGDPPGAPGYRLGGHHH